MGMPGGAKKADGEVCRRRREQVRRWLLEGRTGREIARLAMAKWGHTRRSVYRYLRKVRAEMGLLVPPGAEEEVPEGLRSDGKSYAPRVDAITMAQRVERIQRRIAEGWAGGDIVRAAMREWGIQKPQAMRYLRKAWDGMEEPPGERRERYRAVARRRYVKVFGDAVQEMESPRVRRTEVQAAGPDGQVRRTVTTVTDTAIRPETMTRALQAAALIDRIDGIDERVRHERGRTYGTAERTAPVWQAVRAVPETEIAAIAEPAATAKPRQSAQPRQSAAPNRRGKSRRRLRLKARVA